MAQRHEVEAWINASAWDDRDKAERVVDAIVASGSDDEAEWVRIAGGDALHVVSAAAREHEREQGDADAALESLRSVAAAAVAAVAAGRAKVDVARAAGVSRPTLDKWLAARRG